MLDRPSRALLALTAGLAAFALTGAVLHGPGVAAATPPGRPAVAAKPDAPLPALALQPAVPAGVPVPTPQTGQAPPTVPPPPITVALGGDVHGEPPIADVLDAGRNPLAGVAGALAAADLAVVNLETAVGTAGAPAQKTYTFQASPALAGALADAGVDVVSLANNHALDFGPDAAAETVDVLADHGVVAVGWGVDRAAATAPHVVDVDGRTVAVIGLSRVLPTMDWAAGRDRPGLASAYDEAAAVDAVRVAAAQADHVVVAIHWGRERHTCPDDVQLRLAGQLVAAGADVVAGHHPHVLQGTEVVDGALVAYSLGNLVFYARTPATRQTGILTVTLGEGGVLDHRFTTAAIDGDGTPRLGPLPAPDPSEELVTTGSGPRCGAPATDDL